VRIQSFERTLLPQLQGLVNLHLGTAIPGWALSEAALARHLEGPDDHQPIIDPWVTERETLCIVEVSRLLAAAHLLHYAADRPDVSESYRGAGAIAWFLARPGRTEAASLLLAAAQERLAAWRITREYGWGTGLPAGPLWGIPDAWPHIQAAFEQAGYRVDPAVHHREALYGGWLDSVPVPIQPPIAGLTVRRVVGTYETHFTALLNGQEIGRCEVQPDLTGGGLSPALRGWGWLTNLQVHDGWRNRGIGRWLAQHAAAWLRLAGCDRVVLAVAAESEEAGAGRFYGRLGWSVFVRETHGWQRAAA
jgi:GNAT superfamily N-acetyltransferase